MSDKIIKFQCECCGGKIKRTRGSNFFQCLYCGTDFYQKGEDLILTSNWANRNDYPVSYYSTATSYLASFTYYK